MTAEDGDVCVVAGEVSQTRSRKCCRRLAAGNGVVVVVSPVGVGCWMLSGERLAEAAA